VRAAGPHGHTAFLPVSGRTCVPNTKSQPLLRTQHLALPRLGSFDEGGQLTLVRLRSTPSELTSGSVASVRKDARRPTTRNCSSVASGSAQFRIVIKVTSATTARSSGSVAEAQEADVDKAVAAARRVFDTRPAGRSGSRRAAPPRWRPGRPAGEPGRGDGPPGQFAERHADLDLQPSRGRFSGAAAALFRWTRQGVASEETRPHLLGGTTTVRREPIGVVGAVAPWNYPQTLSPSNTARRWRPAAPSSSSRRGTVLDAMLFAEAVAASDIPPGVINIVPAAARSRVPRAAPRRGQGRLHRFHRGRPADRRDLRAAAPAVTLELGGKSAAIILDDADLDLARSATTSSPPR